jgi:hypothetical protein
VRSGCGDQRCAENSQAGYWERGAAQA